MSIALQIASAIGDIVFDGALGISVIGEGLTFAAIHLSASTFCFFEAMKDSRREIEARYSLAVIIPPPPILIYLICF